MYTGMYTSMYRRLRIAFSSKSMNWNLKYGEIPDPLVPDPLAQTYIYIILHIVINYLKHMNLYMLQTRARTTREDRGQARATQQTHAGARARVHKEPNSARARARVCEESSSARAGAQETKPWARKRATQQRRTRAQVRAQHTVSLFARAETLFVHERRSTRARARFCSRAMCARLLLLARLARACLFARALARALATCPKMLARSRCAPRSCRGSTYELICFEWSQIIYIYIHTHLWHTSNFRGVWQKKWDKHQDMICWQPEATWSWKVWKNTCRMWSQEQTLRWMMPQYVILIDYMSVPATLVS